MNAYREPAPSLTRVRIVFKSGHVEEIECSKFVVEKHGDKIAKLEWENIKPTIMQIDLEQIACVLEVA